MSAAIRSSSQGRPTTVWMESVIPLQSLDPASFAPSRCQRRTRRLDGFGWASDGPWRIANLDPCWRWLIVAKTTGTLLGALQLILPIFCMTDNFAHATLCPRVLPCTN
jgi:hypothetical protein